MFWGRKFVYILLHNFVLFKALCLGNQFYRIPVVVQEALHSRLKATVAEKYLLLKWVLLLA